MDRMQHELNEDEEPQESPEEEQIEEANEPDNDNGPVVSPQTSAL